MQNREISSVKVLVCGAGSIGIRHINNLKSLGVQVLVWRRRTELLDKLKDELDVIVYKSIDEAISQAHAVVIATITSTHIDLALKAAKMNKAIFIEKPISNKLIGLNELLNLVKKNQLVFEVGCQLRSHPNLQKLHKLIIQGDYGPLYTYRAVVGHRLENWRPGTDYRESYSANTLKGGGALLDLIHEIDLVYWFAGPVEKVVACLSHVSDQEMNTEDLVNMILINSNGATGQVQMDMLSPDYRRGFDLVYQKAVFCWDYVKGTLTYKKDGLSTVVDQIPDDFNRNSLFISHMKHFINRLEQPEIPPLCSIEDGIAALCIAEGARLSSKKNSLVDLKEIIL